MLISVRLLTVLFFGLAASMQAQSADRKDQSDSSKKEIEAVIEAFRISIINKDKQGFLQLFYSGATSWVGVYGDSSLKEGIKQHPERDKAYSGTPVGFIETLGASTQRFEEKFSKVIITADQDIAAVSFDYEMLKDGAASNHGHESWHLVRTSSGWKINSVVYSVNF